jgi:hypothetical protein
MANKNYANIPQGTVIKAQGTTATVDRVLYSEKWHDEYDIEFIDAKGNYRHYKQWDDGGEVILPDKKKRPLVNQYGTDCTDIFAKYDYR